MTTTPSEIPATAADPTILARYEDLRRQALHPADPVHRGSGLVLFVQHGMKNWMEAWSQRNPRVPNKLQITAGLEQVLPIQGSRELISILAGMALGSRQEAR